MIREATADDFEHIWPIFHSIVSEGKTYPYPRESDKEQAFYQSINANSWLTVCGQHTEFRESLYNAEETSFKFFMLWLFGQLPNGFDYSLEDMKRFGLTNIVLRDGEWDWRAVKEQPRNRKINRQTVKKQADGQLACEYSVF